MFRSTLCAVALLSLLCPRGRTLWRYLTREFRFQAYLATLEAAEVLYSDGEDAGGGDDVLAHLSPPSTQPYNLSRYVHGSFGSQSAQDLLVDAVLNGSEGLFAVESGAVDGEIHSNTLFFETGRGWQCLLVEANPYYRQPLLQKQRRCHVLHGGLSITDAPGSFKFVMMGETGGFVETWGKESFRCGVEERCAMPSQPEYYGGVVQVRAYPLHLVMHALGRSVIDYWSLDTEGSELAILEHTDFSKLEIGVITVEHTEVEQARQVRSLMERHGFVLVASPLGPVDGDDTFVSTAYMRRRGLPDPQHCFFGCPRRKPNVRQILADLQKRIARYKQLLGEGAV